MTLQRYLENSWIREHRTSPEEIAELLAIAERDVEQSATPGLAAEWRLAIAYNAALQLAVAACAFVKASFSCEPRSLVVGAPAKVARTLTDKEVAWKSAGTARYQQLTEECLDTQEACAPLSAVEADRPRLPEADFKPKYQTDID